MKLKSLITNGVLFVISVLVFIFMSQAYANADYGMFTITGTGYDVIDFAGGANADFLAVCNIFVLILAGLLIVAAVFNVLVAFGIVKNEKLAKIMNYVTFGLAVALAVFAVLSLIMDVVNINDTNKLIGLDIVKIGWACIVNLVLAVVAVVAVVLEKLFKK